MDITEEISRLKRENDAVIAAHNYQLDEIQDIADMVGDSLALAKYCAHSDANTIVLCGVRFMAETAKILSPEKTVLLPEPDAGCPMADMITAEALREAKRRHPDAGAVCYVNSPVAVKAESDVCCTSANAIAVVKALENREIIFAPDKNLGAYVSRFVPEKKIITWAGFCPAHDRMTSSNVLRMKELHPHAQVLVHPECQKDVIDLSDFVGSTNQILSYARQSAATEFIVGTEIGTLYKLKKDNPGKVFYPLSQSLFCADMKKTRLESVLDSLREMRFRIEIDDETRLRASKSIDRMFQIDRSVSRGVNPSDFR